MSDLEIIKTIATLRKENEEQRKRIDLLEEEFRRGRDVGPDIDRVIKTVSDNTSIPIKELTSGSKRHHPSLMDAKCIAIKILKDHIRISYKKIGNCLGFGHHATTIYHYHKLNGYLEGPGCQELKETYNQCCRDLGMDTIDFAAQKPNVAIRRDSKSITKRDRIEIGKLRKEGVSCTAIRKQYGAISNETIRWCADEYLETLKMSA